MFDTTVNMCKQSNQDKSNIKRKKKRVKHWQNVATVTHGQF